MVTEHPVVLRLYSVLKHILVFSASRVACFDGFCVDFRPDSFEAVDNFSAVSLRVYASTGHARGNC